MAGDLLLDRIIEAQKFLSVRCSEYVYRILHLLYIGYSISSQNRQIRLLLATVNRPFTRRKRRSETVLLNASRNATSVRIADCGKTPWSITDYRQRSRQPQQKVVKTFL